MNRNRIEYFEDVSLKTYCSFRIGGKASILIPIKEEEMLRRLVTFFHQHQKKFFVLGKGSKLLFPDTKFPLPILFFGDDFAAISANGTRIEAQAGVSMPKLSQYATQLGLSGMEYMISIPGSVGGGVFMNAGCYGQTTSDIIESVKVITETGEIRIVKKEESEFSYRSSIFQTRSWVIVSAIYRLTPSTTSEVKERMKSNMEKRRMTQPIGVFSAGSVFKNTLLYPAYKLIQGVGMETSKIGDAEVSLVHSNFIINRGNAHSRDVLELIDNIRQKVYDKYAIWMQLELRYVLGRSHRLYHDFKQSSNQAQL